jgi:hydroxyacylglutathione hydrolase
LFFKQFYDDGLAQASYMVGCQANGTAIVVDPRRDIGEYLAEAKRQGLRIIAVTETHIHADYLSGSRELAARSGAKLYLSEEGGPDWQYAFPHEPLRDGDQIRIGNVVIEAVHTPGHTPEHLSFLVTDGATTSEPGFLLSGDFVFVGDVGRPDLLDEAAGYQDTRFAGAENLFASLREKFLTLPDYVQVWPGHGAGSACGKALGAVASSTVGYERRFAWWASALANEDGDGFVSELLSGQPDAPAYFGRMKRQNKAGPALLGERGPLEHLDREALRAKLGEGATLIDTRSREQYAEGAVPGSLSLPAGKNFSTFAGWLIDPERDPRDIVLLAGDETAAGSLRDELSRVGIDRVVAWASSIEGLEVVPAPLVNPEELASLGDVLLLDVRTTSEYEAGHLPGAVKIHAGRLPEHLSDLRSCKAVVVYCQGGTRSAAAASFLRSKGIRNAVDLEGGYGAWTKQAVGA